VFTTAIQDIRIEDVADPGADWQPNLAANALGCEPQDLEDVLYLELARRKHENPRTAMTSTRAIGRKVVVYADRNLGIKLDRDDEVEPVFAELLLKFRSRNLLTAQQALMIYPPALDEWRAEFTINQGENT
jgi:hypothetical protein